MQLKITNVAFAGEQKDYDKIAEMLSAIIDG